MGENFELSWNETKEIKKENVLSNCQMWLCTFSKLDTCSKPVDLPDVCICETDLNYFLFMLNTLALVFLIEIDYHHAFGLSYFVGHYFQ